MSLILCTWILSIIKTIMIIEYDLIYLSPCPINDPCNISLTHSQYISIVLSFYRTK